MNSSIPTIPEEPHREPKRLEDLLIGEVLIKKGILNQKDFLKALQYKISERKNERNISIGDAINITLGNLFQKISLQVGELLVANGLTSTRDMDSARELQEAYQKQGKTKLIGDICVEDLKIVTREALEKILDQQHQIAPILPPITINEGVSTIKTIQESSQKNIPISSMKVDNAPWENFSSSNTPVNSPITTKSSPLSKDTDKEQKNSVAEWLSPTKLLLGEALVKEKYITEKALQEALSYQQTQRKRGIPMLLGEVLMTLNFVDRKKFLFFTESKGYFMQTGELLLAYGFINRKQLEEAIKIQADFRFRWIEKKVGDILVDDMRIVSRERLTQTVAKQKGMVRIIPDVSKVDMGLMFLFEKETLEKYGFIPYKIFQKDDDKGYAITVLHSEKSWETIERIRQEISRKHDSIVAMKNRENNIQNKGKNAIGKKSIETSFDYATPEEISSFLKESFKNEITLRAAAERILTSKIHTKTESTTLWKEDAFRVGRSILPTNNEGLKIFSGILMDSIDARASDIHIEPMKESIRVRIRVDGMLQPLAGLPLWIKESFLKGLMHVFQFDDSIKNHILRDARKNIYYVDKDKHADIRFSVIPARHGDKLVARILVQNDEVPTLGELGIHKNIERKYNLICSMANGIIIVTGPTGSGKTTTLHATLSSLNTPEVNIVTLEDPPEYNLPGANQINVNGKHGMTFHNVLRAVLRQDPDIIMVGEMRDLESAEGALTAGLTGHLLFTTLHTNDAVSAITRLIDMGIKPFLLGSTLVSILGQRLVRKICDNCKIEREPDEKELHYFKRFIDGIDDYIKKYDKKFYYGTGCDCCNHTGFKGRLTIAELFCVNEELKIGVLSGFTAWQLEHIARKHGMTSMIEDGFYRAICGETTLGEVLSLVKTLQFPKIKRTAEEVERLLVGEMSDTEIENAVYGGYDGIDDTEHSGKNLVESK